MWRISSSSALRASMANADAKDAIGVRQPAWRHGEGEERPALQGGAP